MEQSKSCELSPFVLSGSSPPSSDSERVSQNHQDTIGRQKVVQPSGEWLTAEEAACYLRCAVKTLYNSKSKGDIKAYNCGGKKKGKLLFKKSDLDAFITGKRRV
jgi:excisionase family DNA binding protein